MTCVRAATFNLLTAATFNQLTTFFVASSDSDVYVCLVCCQIYLACRSLLLLYYPAPAPTRVGVGVVVVRARLRPTPTLVLVQEQSKRDKYFDTVQVQAMGIMRQCCYCYVQ